MRQLSGVDAMHVLEETRAQHMHTIKIAVLGPHPDNGPVSVDEVLAWASERLPRIPPLRWRLQKIPLGLGRPVFIDAGPFDVTAHVRVESLPPPGSDEQLDEVVSRLASTQLDRRRPLWELTVVRGLSGDRTALVFKLHHAIMDGQASVRFLEVAFDGAVEMPFGPPPQQAEPVPSAAELVRFALASQARLYAKLPAVVRRTATSIADNRARKKQGVPPVVNPLSGPSTSFNKRPQPERVYIDVTVPFGEIKAIKDATKSTINEVFVALCGGAMRRYLHERGEEPDRCLNCAHPVSLRQPDQNDDFGNRTSYWYVSLGTDIEDPIERLGAVKESLGAAREWAKGDQELFSVWQDYYLLFGVVTLKTLTLAERLTKRPAFNAIVSNVRGPRPLSLGAAPVVDVRSMGPVTRVLGLNMTAWSYGDNFSIGLQSCRAFLPDLRSFDRHIRDELEAFRKAATDL